MRLDSAHLRHARQVADAKLACVNGTSGWLSAAGTVILGRE